LWMQSMRSPGANSTGAGPFTIMNRTIDSATLDGFASYYQGKPVIDHVELRPYKDARNAWSALLRGEIDFLYEVTPEAMDFIQGSSATQVKSFLSPFVYTLGFNQRHAVLRNRDVRVALNEAINRDEIVKVQFGGRGLPATSPLFPKHWAYDPNLPAFHYAPADVNRRLDAAGLPVTRVGDRRTPSRFRFSCLLPEGDPRFERIGLMLQRQLLEVGVDMTLEAVPTQTLVKRLGSGDFDTFLFVMSSSTLDFVYLFWHSPEAGARPMLETGYHGADAALDRLRLARNDDETRAAVTELQHALYEDPPMASLCWAETARAVSGRFRLPTVSDRDILRTVWQWKPATDGSPAEATSAAGNSSPWRAP
jgi:peptide/nickel transport system substrate-binding protein